MLLVLLGGKDGGKARADVELFGSDDVEVERAATMTRIRLSVTALVLPKRRKDLPPLAFFSIGARSSQDRPSCTFLLTLQKTGQESFAWSLT